MKEYPTVHEILTMHTALIDAYGGSHGLRDPGALEAALFRPQSGYYTDIIEEAAALTESLLVNHTFVDGNKRIAFAACYVFLDINGYTLHAEPAWLHSRVMFWLELQRNRFETIVTDLRSCVTQR